MSFVSGSGKRQTVCSEIRGINVEAERANAFTMHYEPLGLEGKRLCGAGYTVDHNTAPDGFYYYGVRIDETGEGEECIFVNQYPLKENVNGVVVLDVPIDFHGENQISMRGTQFLNNVPLASLERLLERKSDGPAVIETADFYMAQG